jgi:hypothetical protein
MQALEPLNRSADVRDPQITMRLAWLTLVLAFAVFLAAAGTTLNNLWQWYQSADDPRESVLVLRSQPEGLSFRPAGRTVFQGVTDGQPVLEGETVRALPTAGYGQVATLKVFDGSQFDLWAGSSLDVETLRTSRWHQASIWSPPPPSGEQPSRPSVRDSERRRECSWAASRSLEHFAAGCCRMPRFAARFGSRRLPVLRRWR